MKYGVQTESNIDEQAKVEREYNQQTMEFTSIGSIMESTMESRIEIDGRRWVDSRIHLVAPPFSLLQYSRAYS